MQQVAGPTRPATCCVVGRTSIELWPDPAWFASAERSSEGSGVPQPQCRLIQLEQSNAHFGAWGWARKWWLFIVNHKSPTAIPKNGHVLTRCRPVGPTEATGKRQCCPSPQPPPGAGRSAASPHAGQACAVRTECRGERVNEPPCPKADVLVYLEGSKPASLMRSELGDTLASTGPSYPRWAREPVVAGA